MTNAKYYPTLKPPTANCANTGRPTTRGDALFSVYHGARSPAFDAA